MSATMVFPDKNYSIILTSDGSHTVAKTDEMFLFHSRHGALQESRHIFIQNGLSHYLKSHPNLNEIRILEVGFGTGLNALLTLLESIRLNTRIHYTGLDKSPLPLSVIRALNHSNMLSLNQENQHYYYSWFDQTINSTEQVTKHGFSFNLLTVDFNTCKLPGTYDLIYYDSFGPDESPEMWNLNALSKIKELLKPQGQMLTFCAKGSVKRTLKTLGLHLENPPGPVGKREITRCTKMQ